MSERVFSKMCPECRHNAVSIETVPYGVQIDHDGRTYDVSIPELSVPRCSHCGAFSIDYVAGLEIDKAFRKTAGLLSAQEIESGRLGLRLTQPQLAEYLAIAVGTISRWENGYQVQQRCHDGLLRAFFKMESLRSFLAVLHDIPLAAS